MSIDLEASLKAALRAIDAAATTTPESPDGRMNIAHHLGVARQHVAGALAHLNTRIPDSEVDTVRAYFQTLDEFVSASVSQAAHVAFFVLPLPLDRTRAHPFVVRSDATHKLLDLVLETINNREIDIAWMMPGDFDYTSGPDYVEVETVRRKQLQSLRVYQTGCVAFRDPVSEKQTYSLERFERLLEVTISFARRFYERLGMSTPMIAVQSAISHASRLEIQVIEHGTIDNLRFRTPRDLQRVPELPMMKDLSSEPYGVAREATTSLFAMLQ